MWEGEKYTRTLKVPAGDDKPDHTVTDPGLLFLDPAVSYQPLPCLQKARVATKRPAKHAQNFSPSPNATSSWWGPMPPAGSPTSGRDPPPHPRRSPRVPGAPVCSVAQCGLLGQEIRSFLPELVPNQVTMQDCHPCQRPLFPSFPFVLHLRRITLLGNLVTARQQKRIPRATDRPPPGQ